MDFTGERFIPSAGLGQEIEIEHVQRYRAILALAAGKTVLDVATGAGYGGQILAERAKMVCGLEIDPEAVALAKERYGDANLFFIRGSVNSLPFPAGTFDLLVSFETIEHLSEETQKAFLQEIKRVLKPGGLLVMSTPDRLIYSDLPDYHNEYHLKEFYRNEYSAFLGSYFRQVKIWEQVALLSYLIATGIEVTLRQIHISSSQGSLQGKYLVALCSDGMIPEVSLGCITLDCEGLHQKKIDRVIALQGEIEGKNQDIKNVWDEVHKRDSTIAKMFEHVQNLEEKVREFSADVIRKQIAIDQVQAELKVCQATVERAEAQLGKIYRTKAWRFIQKMYRMKNLVW